MQVENSKIEDWNKLSDQQKQHVEDATKLEKAELGKKIKIVSPPDLGQGLGVAPINVWAGLAFLEGVETENGFDFELYRIQ